GAAARDDDAAQAATRDYCQVLGVWQGASDAELKKAYRQLAMQFHPDKNPGDKKSEERFKEVNEAYGVLSDPDKRAHYDRFGSAPGAGAGGGFEGGFGTLFEDIFENFFSGAGGGRRGRSRAMRGEDLQYELKITLEDAAAGLETKIQIPRLERCETCKGTGSEPGTHKTTCDTCQGRGEVRMSHGFLTVARPCPRCGGEGQINKRPCPDCRGHGRLRGKGMPRLRERGHGDACYRLLLEVPQKLSGKQREALEAFEAASREQQRGPLASAFIERMKKLLG